MKKLLLKMEKITKRFPGVLALDEVDLEVYEGEILGLVGENGAGKTTLIEILNPHPAPTGFFRQDEGRILLNGEEIRPKGPRDMLKLGICIIHQHFNLAPNLSIAENIFLGREPSKRLRILDKGRLRSETENWLGKVGVRLDPLTLVKDLGVAQRQMVEIAKALSLEAKLIIMDEPTSSLAREEVERLFNIMKDLRLKGISFLFITHRIEEVLEIADRITVLRDGRVAGSVKREEANLDQLIGMMVGRKLSLFPKEKAKIGEIVLEVRNLSSNGTVKDVSFALRRGEILGFAGLVGAGRTEMARAIFGVDPRRKGEIYLEGERIKIGSPRDAVREGMGFVPEDRQLQGLILNMAVRENLTLPCLEDISKALVISLSKEREIADDYIHKLSIQTPSLEQKVRGLSGGNQQKVVLAKWLALKPKVLILDEPTRGIDVGAKVEVHRLISNLAQQGIGIMMISSELPEILAMSDRILVMVGGRVSGEFSREEATQEGIMQCAIKLSSAVGPQQG